MKFVVNERPDDIVVISWAEPTVVDVSRVAKLREQVAEVERDRIRIVFDMSQVEFIDSSVVKALVEFLQRARATGGDVKLASLTPDIEMIFELTRLQQLFRIHPSVDAAIQDFDRPLTG